MIAAHELVRIVFPHTLAMRIGGKSRTGVQWRRSSKKIVDRLAHVTLRRRSGQALRRQ
jgi:hypothetical protein